MYIYGNINLLALKALRTGGSCMQGPVNIVPIGVLMTRLLELGTRNAILKRILGTSFIPVS